MPEQKSQPTVMAAVTLFQEPIEVPVDEVAVLRSQGLLRSEPVMPGEQPATGAKSAPAARKDTTAS
jgi:hypothetical protein